MNLQVLVGDCRETLRTLADESVQCCVTSPPYWGLRDYGHPGQIGQEKTPELFVQTMVQVFREVRRVLKADGTCWVNLGDSYNAAGRTGHGTRIGCKQGTNRASATKADNCRPSVADLKPKDLVGIPWMVALALRADGWYLRQDIIWAKPNPMPESVTDRCTKSHEYIFLLTKAERYFYDHEAIKEKASENTHARVAGNGAGSWKGSQFHKGKTAEHQLGRASVNRKFYPGAGNKNNASFDAAMQVMPEIRNKRSVWTVPTMPYKEAHFATYPPDLIKPCILAGTRPGDVVLDPFGGSGTTGQVALELGRGAVLCELNPEYAKIIERRTAVTPGLPLEFSGKEAA